LVIGLYAIVAGLSELVFAVRLRRGVSQTVSHLTTST
jgi:hypothetical protein